MCRFTNQVMDLFTSIHLAILSSRIPVIAPIMPDTGHLGGPAAPLPLGDVFDLSFLSALKETPIVEMHELKTDFRSAERNKVVVYDGEVPVRPGGVLGEEEWQVGDGVPAEEPEGEDIGCWSSGLSWHDSATWWGGMDPACMLHSGCDVLARIALVVIRLTAHRRSGGHGRVQTSSTACWTSVPLP